MSEEKGSHVVCAKCGHKISVSIGGGKIVGSGTISVPCPKCGHRHDYSPKDAKIS